MKAQISEFPYDKGEFRIKLALPYFNHLLINPSDEASSSDFGFLGESLGLEYSISNRSFLEINAALAITSNNPFPFPWDRSGPYKILSTTFVSATYNRVIRRFTIGTGLNYSNNLISRGSRSLGDTTILNYTDNRQIKAIGLTLNGFYRLGKAANVGLIYRPTLYMFEPLTAWNYGHLISLEFNWRIRLNNK